MLESIEEPARQLTDEDIKKLERKLAVSLPDKYKQFLLRYNGGRPVPDCFPIKGLPNNPYGGIQVFFGIDREIESSNLDEKHEVFEGRLPKELIPIASDGSGDILCLSLGGENEGQVLFWDYYGELNPPTFENLYFVANSFQELLDGLFDFPGE